MTQYRLEVMPGEILSVLGENGAGKSTLMKIIFGSVTPDEGEIYFDGRKVNISSPADARELGIAMVFQHFVLFETLTAKENILLGMPEGTDPKELEKEIIEKSRHYGIEVDPNAIVNDLSMGERQRVEILRALLTNPKLLILDEPTSVLSPLALQALFKTLRQLSSEGVSIIFITHKLNEIRELSKHCTVIRSGEVAANINPQEMTEQELAKLMIGQRPSWKSCLDRKSNRIPVWKSVSKVKRLALRAATRSTARLTFPAAESSAWPVSPETARRAYEGNQRRSTAAQKLYFYRRLFCRRPSR